MAALRRLCAIANAGLCAGRLAIPDQSVYTLCRRFKTDEARARLEQMYKQQLEEAVSLNKKQLEQYKQQLEQKDKQLEQKDKQLEQNKQQLEQKEKQLEEEVSLNKEKEKRINELKDAAIPLKQGSYVEHDEDHIKTELGIALSCFKKPYLGDGADRLKSALEKRLKDFESGRRNYYAKYVALSNSSCMGKSRTVLQLGHKKGVFVFYCSTAKEGATTFPPRTPLLAPKLQLTTSTAGMTFYFVAWINVLLKFLDKEPGADPAKRWLEDQEKSFFLQSSGTGKQVLDEWEDLGRRFGGDYTGTIENKASEETRLQELLDDRIKLVLKQLPGDTKMTVLKLLFVVDEAKGLLTSGSTPSVGDSTIREIPFLHLRRAAQKLGPSTLLLVTDTSSRVGRLAPAGEDDESRRAREADRELLHPVYGLNRLDLFERKHPTPGQDAKAWLEDPDRWTRYGRALWALRFAQEKEIRKVLELAQTKLLNISKVGPEEKWGEKRTRLLTLAPHKLSPEQSLCLLVFTVGIDILPWNHCAQELVSSHMTAMALISKDRRRFWTVAPLEPVLSAAAGDLLQDVDVLQKALLHFKESLQNGFTSMSKGDRAEMVCKIFVMMAMWECQASAFKEEGKYLSCVKTSEFLKYLLGDAELPKVDKTDVLEGSYVFFNRMVCMDHVPSRKEALEFLKRGVVCAGNADNQNRGADIHIFVWFPKAKKPDAGAIPVEGVQAKKPDAGAIPVEEEITRLVISVKAGGGQPARNLTARFVGIRVQEPLPYVGIAYRANDCHTDAKVVAPVEAGQYVYKLNGRPRLLAEGRWKGCMKVLQDIIEVDPVNSATTNDKLDYVLADPWTRKGLLPEDLKKEVKEDAVLFALKGNEQDRRAQRADISNLHLRL